MNKLIWSVIASLVVGGGAGYMIGQNSAGNLGMSAKDAQEAVAMMKDQAVTIKTMSEMMKEAGTSMEGWSAKYSDNDMMMMSKDMQTLGSKYMKASNTHSSDTMNGMMGN